MQGGRFCPINFKLLGPLASMTKCSWTELVYGRPAQVLGYQFACMFGSSSLLRIKMTD